MVRKILVLLALVNLPVFAQFTTASLGGSVFDPGGSAVPEATVKVQNMDTGLEQAVKTGVNGQFVLSTLPVGRYRLTVEKQGFATYVQEGIRLTVNQAASQTITLKVGSVSESVTVAADAELVATRTATSGQLVDQRKIVDLPLNGRQAQALIYLAPGTVDTTSRYCGVNCFGGVYPGEQQAAVNGTGPGQVNYQLDGAGHNDTYLNMNLPFPNPDSVQEFTLDSNNLSAQFGNSAGGVVNIVTRSGTNEVHGDVFEFLRNGDLNARNFFAPTHDTLKRNQFGGAAGGPIQKNKLFFFGTYQGTRVRQAPQGQIGFVPTAAERSGDFSDLLPKTLKDPITSIPYPNNQIPASQFSSITQKLLPYIPLPNGPGRQLTYTGPPVRQSDNQYMGKVDYNWGRQQISGRYLDTKFSQDPALFTDNILQADSSGNQVHIRNVAVNDTFTARPNLLFNTWFGWNSQTGGAIPAARFGWPDIGVNIVQPDGEPPESYLSIGNAFTANTGWKGAFDRGDYTLREDVTWIKSSHELHFGAELVRLEKHIVNTYRMGGFFTFNNNLSGDNLADLLIGRVSQFVQGGGEFTYMTGTRLAAYIQDNWRASQRLTINLGLRWDPFFPFQEQDGRVNCFQPGAQSVKFPNAPLGLTVGGDPGCPAPGTDNQIGNFSPRVGLAYRLTKDGKTSLRAGFGMYYTQASSDTFTMQTNAPFSPQYFLNGVDFADPYGSAGISSNPFPAQYALHLPSSDVAFTRPVGIN
ncbi:MAG TPA: TonB-dependent receptor, partial [Bryobacteraceae bacterium]|nr:TonB-dependent receptor [Bryobacteraceae bacterium]